MQEHTLNWTKTFYSIATAKTGYWLSGKFLSKENAIKEFNKRKARIAELGIPHDGLVLVEYTEGVEGKVIAGQLKLEE